eukprot:685277-Pleurochrysis_carterae.AAC.2
MERSGPSDRSLELKGGTGLDATWVQSESSEWMDRKEGVRGGEARRSESIDGERKRGMEGGPGVEGVGRGREEEG